MANIVEKIKLQAGDTVYDIVGKKPDELEELQEKYDNLKADYASLLEVVDKLYYDAYNEHMPGFGSGSGSDGSQVNP